MRINKSYYLLFLIGILSTTVAAQETWYKGNLHSQSYWSDGDDYPEMIMEWYKSQGYNFVALSDHNSIAEGEKWKRISNDSIYQQAFKDYLQKFGEDWVEYKRDSTGLHVKLKTFSEFQPVVEEDGSFIVIQAEEVTTYLDRKAVHMGAINVEELIEPQEGNTIVELMQNNLDAIIAYRERTGKPVLQHLNHPNFTYAITAQDIMQLEGERFFEVYNGHPYVHNYGDSIHSSTEQMWDEVNISYLKQGKPIMYGLATDDGHHYHRFGENFSNAGRGWVMVRSDELSTEAMIENLQAGNFYSSTGVELEELTFDENQLHIEVKPQSEVNYKIEFIGAKKGKEQAEVLETVEGTTATFNVTDDFQFVRAKVISDKLQVNPHKEGDMETAWIQPVIGE